MIEPSTLLMITAIIGGFLVVFPLLWCAVVLLLSYAGGWQRLARRFRAGSRPLSGVPHTGVWGMVGWVSYRFVLKVHVGEEGFFLDIMPLFRIGHPRLFIPWTSVGTRHPLSFAFWKAERIVIGTLAVITLPLGILPAAPPPTSGAASPARRSG